MLQRQREHTFKERQGNKGDKDAQEADTKASDRIDKAIVQKTKPKKEPLRSCWKVVGSVSRLRST
jgi:hypothetical protein